jgi:hypothetical protein
MRRNIVQLNPGVDLSDRYPLRRYLSIALFRLPLSEPCLRLLPHTALQFPASSWASNSHFAYHPRALQYSLPPFVMSQALPWVFGYYGDSVALRVSPGRQSCLYDRRTIVCLGSPFVSFPRSLSGTHRKEFSCVAGFDALLRCRRFRYVAADVFFHRWRLGFNQFRLSLYHAHKTRGTASYIPSDHSALPTCCFPSWISPPGRLVVLGGNYSNPLLLWSNPVIAETAHPSETRFS